MAWNIVLGPPVILLGFAVSALLAQLLGVAGYAAYAVVLALQTTLVGFGDLGITGATSRFVPETQARGGSDSLRRLLVVLVGVRLVQGCILAALALLLAGLVAQLSSGAFVATSDVRSRLALLVVIETVSSVTTAALGSLLRQRDMLIAIFSSSLLRALGFGLLLSSGLSDLVLVLDTTIAASAIRLVLTCTFLWRHRGHGVSSQTLWLPGPREAIGTALSSWWDKVINTVLGGQALLIVAAAFVTPAQLGLFALATDLSTRALAGLLTPLNSVVLPVLSETFARAEDASTRARVYRQLIRVAALLLIPGVAVVAGVATPLVIVLFGRSFEAAVVPFQILLVLGGFEFTFYFVGNAAWLVVARYRRYAAVRTASVLFLAFYPFTIAMGSALWLAVANAGVQLASAGLLVSVLAATTGYLTVPIVTLLRVLFLGSVSFAVASVPSLLLGATFEALVLGLFVGAMSAVVGALLTRTVPLGEFKAAVSNLRRSEGQA